MNHATVSSSPIIEAEDVHCSHGSFQAVNGVSLRVFPGQVFALLGTNGAGKTTLMDTLEGHRAPTRGKVTVMGGDPRDRKRVRPHVGIMLQEGGHPPDLSVAEALRLTGALSGRPDSADNLLDQVGIRQKAKTLVSKLSGGERRRLDFAAAIWGRPEVLFLDEPTTGLDPSARESLWSIVEGLRDGGSTIFLTTHYLEEAQRYADNIALMHEGVVRRQGTISEVLAVEPSTIKFTSPVPLSALPLRTSGVEGPRVVVETRSLQSDLALLLEWAAASQHELTDISATTSSLDDVFKSLASSERKE